MGVIGLGMMGSQIALRLALKGHNVTVFNRDRSKIEKLLTNGTTNLKMAHQPNISDVALIYVKDYQAIENVTFMTGGLIETTNADLVVIQCSTISPDESSKIADLYSKKQIKMLSVPMLGGTTVSPMNQLLTKR